MYYNPCAVGLIVLDVAHDTSRISSLAHRFNKEEQFNEK